MKGNAALGKQALGFELGASIDVRGLRRVRFGDDMVCGKPRLRPHRRHQHEALNASARGAGELPDHVSVDAGIDVLRQMARRMRDAGKMQNMRRAVDERRPVSFPCEVWEGHALHASRLRDRRRIAGGSAHGPAVRGKRAHHRLADEARRSGNEHEALRGCHLPPRARHVEHKAGRARADRKQQNIGDWWIRAMTAAIARPASSRPRRNTRAVTCGAVMPAITARW